MEQLHLTPTRHMSGTITLPGSKSIANRALLLAALSKGSTLVRDKPDSDDINYMMTALKLLGVEISQIADSRNCRITGVGGEFPVKNANLYLGNAGTVFRPLTAVLAMMQGHYQLSGVPRMHDRPILDLVDALRVAGAQVHYQGKSGYPPLSISPAQLKAEPIIPIKGNVSSQFLSGLLLALPLTGETAVIEVRGRVISKPYIEITLNLMARFSIQVEQEGWSRFIIPGNQAYISQGDIPVEGDASSASYFLSAGALAGGPVRVEGVGASSIQGDIKFTDVLRFMGVNVSMGSNWIETSAQLPLRAIDADLNHMPDAAMTVAVLALAAEGTSTLRNIGSWRVKETDRLSAMASELRKVGAIVEEGSDFIRITPPKTLQAHATIETYEDHRMAMCFSLLPMLGTHVSIKNPQCVAKTFPNYFEVLAGLRNQK